MRTVLCHASEARELAMVLWLHRSYILFPACTSSCSQVCNSDNAFGIEMFTGIYSIYLDSESSNSEGRCCWKVICPGVGGEVAAAGGGGVGDVK